MDSTCESFRFQMESLEGKPHQNTKAVSHNQFLWSQILLDMSDTILAVISQQSDQVIPFLF